MSFRMRSYGVSKPIQEDIPKKTVQKPVQKNHLVVVEKKNDEKNEWIGGARSSSSSLLGEKIALFSCIIMRIPKLFDGNKSLMNVHVGDKVDILEENVGPDGMYHFCRLKRECEGGIGRKDNDGDDKNGEDANDHYYNFGWFPISCLKRES